MSNHQNEQILERLYDEAYEQLVKHHRDMKALGYITDEVYNNLMSEKTLHEAAMALAKKRYEFDVADSSY